jgi:hypothetical protein
MGENTFVIASWAGVSSPPPSRLPPALCSDCCTVTCLFLYLQTAIEKTEAALALLRNSGGNYATDCPLRLTSLLERTANIFYVLYTVVERRGNRVRFQLNFVLTKKKRNGCRRLVNLFGPSGHASKIFGNVFRYMGILEHGNLLMATGHAMLINVHLNRLKTIHF